MDYILLAGYIGREDSKSKGNKGKREVVMRNRVIDAGMVLYIL